jgi:hypothetical protein
MSQIEKLKTMGKAIAIKKKIEAIDELVKRARAKRARYVRRLTRLIERKT